MQRRWKSLRDSYNRERAKQKTVKSGSAASGRKQYVFFDQLSFLAVLQEVRPVLDQQLDNDQEEDASEEINPTKKRRKNVSNNENIENELLRKISENITNKKRQDDDNDDPDRNFLLSFVPDLKGIHDDLKLEIKADIINIFRKYKNHNPMQSYQTQPPYYAYSTQSYNRDYNAWVPIPGPWRDYRQRNVSIQGSPCERNAVTTPAPTSSPSFTTTIVSTASPAPSSMTDSSTIEDMFNDNHFLAE